MLAIALLLSLFVAHARAAYAGQRWLLVSDIHLDPFDRSATPAVLGKDANVALLDSAIARMRHIDPNPPIVILAGDFLAHHFEELAKDTTAESARADALATMRIIARRFARAFPHATFAVALGNNDDYCGDYRSNSGGPYMRELQRIWQPLIERPGGHSSFTQTFSRGGFYSIEALHGRLRLLVLNDVPWALFYGGSCEGLPDDIARRERSWLLDSLAGTQVTALIGHIPLGIDGRATAMARGLLVVPFLQHTDRDVLSRAIENPRTTWAVFGHEHRSDLLSIAGKPVVLASSISPVYGNNPSFEVLDLGEDGSLRDIETNYFDESRRVWRTAPSLDRTYGIRQLDSAALARIHADNANVPKLRARWTARTMAWARPARETTGTHWRYRWCTNYLDIDAYVRCASLGAKRWLAVGLLCGVVGGAIAALLYALRRRNVSARR